MTKGSTVFLRGVLYLIALVVLAICAVALPAGIISDTIGAYRPILLGLYIPAVPFFYALYQANRLLGCIDTGTAFSTMSVTALNRINRAAIAISVMFSAGMPYIYYVAEIDDAPGIILLGLVIIFASVVIATFAAVLAKLLQDALEIKSENDLTV